MAVIGLVVVGLVGVGVAVDGFFLSGMVDSFCVLPALLATVAGTLVEPGEVFADVFAFFVLVVVSAVSAFLLRAAA